MPETEKPEDYIPSLTDLRDRALERFWETPFVAEREKNVGYGSIQAAGDELKGTGMSPIELVRSLSEQTEVAPVELEIDYINRGTWHELFQDIAVFILEYEMKLVDPHIDQETSRRIDASEHNIIEFPRHR